LIAILDAIPGKTLLAFAQHDWREKPGIAGEFLRQRQPNFVPERALPPSVSASLEWHVVVRGIRELSRPALPVSSCILPAILRGWCIARVLRALHLGSFLMRV